MTSVHSDWGDWLPAAIADADPDDLAIWYLGCNGFAVKSAGGTTLFIDPYLGTGDPPRTVRMIPVPFDPADVRAADAVLATHEHSDHVDGPSQAPILERTGAPYLAPGASLSAVEEADWRGRWDLAEDQFREVAAGDEVVVGDLTVTVGTVRDPDADQPVSYLVEHEGTTFFHGGDARPGGFGGMTDRDIDVGALAFGSSGTILDKETREPRPTTWYNDEAEVVAAAGELELDTLVPTHWDMWKGLTADPTALHHHVTSLSYPKGLEILEIGDRLDI